MSPDARDVERRRLYRERIIRHLVIQRPGWDAEWSPEDKKKLEEVQEEFSVCRILRYQAPTVVSDKDIFKHPVVHPVHDDSLMQGLMRLQIAMHEPERQFELFGWRTPPPGALYAEKWFEQNKAVYWGKILAEPLGQLDVLKDTADFGANYLLRLLYLHGSVPPPLRSILARWRPPGSFERDVNFSSTVEATIRERLLGFKYWLDAPFAASDPARPDDTRLLQDARKRKKDKPVKYDQEELGAEMCYWSENHQVLFGTAEYLAGQLWPDAIFRAGRNYRAEGPDAVRPGDLIGRQHVARARERLLSWLNDRLRFGLSEFNAPGYYGEDFSALFNLVDFALDEEIRVRASMVLDLMLFDVARLSHDGSFGLAAGRSHFKHKNCGYQQSMGDVAEVIFGRRGAIVETSSGSAGSYATSMYQVPEVLLRIAHDQPAELRDRRRLSLDPEEASLYGVGMETDDDVLFWWSRGAFLNKHIIAAATRVIRDRHLGQSNPFREILPKLYLVAIVKNGGDVVDTADDFSVLTEGSGLTQTRLTAYRIPEGVLSSVRGLHPQQLGFQAQYCQATLSMGATVWATQPTAPSENLQDMATVSGIGAGAGIGAAIGSIFGPIGAGIGAIAGGIAGGIGAHEATADGEQAIEIFPSAKDGPDEWTGSVTIPFVAQVDGAAILAFSPRALQWWLFESKTHAWFPKPAFDEGSVVQRSAPNSTEDDGKWTFGRVGDGYVGLYSAREPSWTTEGPWKDRELTTEGDGNVYILQIGNRDQFGSYEQFITSVSSARINVSDLGDDETQCSYDVPHGQRLELHLEGHQVRYGGAQISSNFPRFESPYIAGSRVGNRSYRYTIAHGKYAIHHDFEEIKTRGTSAHVKRIVDGSDRTPGDLPFLAIARRGAMRLFPENTIEAFQHSINEGANGLVIDCCLTRDGQIVAWVDQDPSSLSAIFRRLGAGDIGRYKPIVPLEGSTYRRPIIDLTAAEFQTHYSYEPVSAFDTTAPAVSTLPTLREIVTALQSSPRLRQIILDLHVPVESAESYGPALVRAVRESLPSSPGFQTTLRTDEMEVARALKRSLPASEHRMNLCFHWRIPEPPDQTDSNNLATTFPSPVRSQAIDAAIELGLPVASIGPVPSSADGAFSATTPILADLWNWDAFNFNPKRNNGRQIERFIAGPLNDLISQSMLVDQEISGIITDDVPQLLKIVRNKGLNRG